MLPFLASCFLWGQTGADDAEWSRFLSWLKASGQAFRGGVLGLLAAYREKLTAEGMAAPDADALVARVQLRTRNDPEFTRLNFNRIYSMGIDGRHALRTAEPNRFLIETVATLQPGRALDVGMGEGRNAIYLAQKGWDVTGIDLSDVGIAKARERARSLGLRINAVVEDVNRFPFGAAQWDLICLLYFVIDESMPNLRQRIATALKPGGLAIAEGVGSGGTLDALLQAWSKWQPVKLRLLRLEYLDGPSEWGGTGIGRLLLQKAVSTHSR